MFYKLLRYPRVIKFSGNVPISVRARKSYISRRYTADRGRYTDVLPRNGVLLAEGDLFHGGEFISYLHRGGGNNRVAPRRQNSSVSSVSSVASMEATEQIDFLLMFELRESVPVSIGV